jgi:hypothetical protein
MLLRALQHVDVASNTMNSTCRCRNIWLLWKPPILDQKEKSKKIGTANFFKNGKVDGGGLTANYWFTLVVPCALQHQVHFGGSKLKIKFTLEVQYASSSYALSSFAQRPKCSQIAGQN